MARLALVLAAVCMFRAVRAADGQGYYRFPALHDDTLYFVAEGDVWRVPASGGPAQRVTSGIGEETHPAVSPDGKTLAFTATYEGPAEVYTMPVEGGLPRRMTFDGSGAVVAGWTPDGKILFATRHYSTLPNTQLATLDPATAQASLFELSQAADGAVDAVGNLFFTRQPFQGSNTKRYQGGTVQALWRFDKGAPEAVPLTANFPGTSKSPMLYNGRVYFVSDRDGTMNLWTMASDGGDLHQLTRHAGWDVQSPSLSRGRIAYQLGADIRIYDLDKSTDAAVPIRLVSDFEHLRERWVRNPLEMTSSIHLSPTGDRVALTARGQVFVAPVFGGRIVEAARGKTVRYREARFLPDGNRLLALSDQTGEVELGVLPANGIGAAEILTNDSKVLRWEALPSPDGKRIAHRNKDHELWILTLDHKKNERVAVCDFGDYEQLAWSHDSRFLAFVEPGANTFHQIKIYAVETGKTVAATTDRYDSMWPAWSADGKWLFFLSDRTFHSLVGAPWGARQPEPFFDRKTRIYFLALQKGLRSPFQHSDELHLAPKLPSAPTSFPSTVINALTGSAPKTEPAKPKTDIDFDGLAERLFEVAAAPPGNYERLEADTTRLFFESIETIDPRRSLKTLDIASRNGLAPETLVDDSRGFELSADGRKLLVRRGDDVLVLDTSARGLVAADLGKNAVNLRGWSFSFDPREEWRQMFAEAWRLERDYFYDRNMHGVDWLAIKKKYEPLVERVTDRSELSDVLAQMVSELSALHIFVHGGDIRKSADQIETSALGAVLQRDEAGGGYRIAHIYASDPDLPASSAPLARPGVDVAEGDVIEAIDGVPALSVPDVWSLLRNQAEKQVLLRVKPKVGGKSRDTIVVPESLQKEADLRYGEWEYTRRKKVEELGAGKIGYVHLRAMSGENIAEWAREYYPVFNRDGLIVDVRHNNGGNIDSWVLEKLLRKAWFYWKPRVGKPYWNMQYAFRGHVVVLCDERTASDGEAFSEGFRRLGLGKVLGTRTWGGEIWLSQSNHLVDRGIATAAEIGVYGPESQWLIEGHGVDPDIVVDNLPHATFKGEDAQLNAAIAYLQEQIRLKPVPIPEPPKAPDKSWKNP